MPDVPATSRPATVCRDGLWHNNPALVQLLGLCPLLAVTTTLVNGLALALATTATLLVTSTLVSCARPWLRAEIRIPLFVIIIASTVTAIELVMSAWFRALHDALGIFLPLIVTNCIIIARAETFASRHRPGLAALDALMTGAGFALVLVSLAALRELLGRGTLLAGAEQLFGPAAADWTLTLGDFPVVLLAALPPGAFILLGLLAALRPLLDRHARARAAGPHPVRS